MYHSGPLAYIEVFTAFTSSVSTNRTYATKPDLDSHNRRRTLVIPVSDIAMACHLAPKFHLLDPRLNLTPRTDLLSLGSEFWLNHYYNHFFYQLVEHWRHRQPRMLDKLRRHVRWIE